MGPLQVAGGCGVKGSWRRGLIPWVSQDRREGPRRTPGMGQAVGPGPGLGAALAPLASSTRGCGSVFPQGGQDTGVRGPGGQVVGDWPSAGAQLWGVSPKAAEELESRRACGGLW